MMNKEMMNRLRIAAGFQKQAVFALLPNRMEEHLDVIGKELKLMFAESVTKLLSEDRCDTESKSKAADDHAQGIKKVTIE